MNRAKRAVRTTVRTAVRILVVSVVIAAAVFAGYNFLSRASAQQEAVAAAGLEPMRQAEVKADAYVVPARYAGLSVIAAGRVTAIPATEGQAVKTGDILLALDDNIQQQALAQAEANVAVAKASLSQLKAGPRPEEIAQAEAVVAQARARLDGLANGPTPEQVATAHQAVMVAQANLDRVKAGPAPEQLNEAAAALASAEAAVRQAQSAYDKVAGQPDVGARPESLKLEQATNEFNRAKAAYQNLVNGATPAEIEVYRQQIAQAQASLNQVLAGATSADVDAARAQLQQAEAALALIKAGARPDAIAAAEAQVSLARAGVAQARASLDQMVLRAPFDGTVGAINVAVGEYLSPGAVAVRLGDTGAWAVETDDLTETEVVRLSVGDAVEVVVDALPGKTFTGSVQRIRPAGEMKRGDVTYTATIALTPTGEPLLWGMSAAVSKYR